MGHASVVVFLIGSTPLNSFIYSKSRERRLTHGHSLVLLRRPVLLSPLLLLLLLLCQNSERHQVCSFVCGPQGLMGLVVLNGRCINLGRTHAHKHNVVRPTPIVSLQPLHSTPGPCLERSPSLIPFPFNGVSPVSPRCLCRGLEGVLLQIRRGEGVHGDAGSRYQAVEVRRRRVRSGVLSPDASCSSMLFHESCREFAF